MMRKTAPALLLALAATMTASACGGSGDTPVAATTPQHPRGQQDCDAKGINRQGLKEGTCKAHGSTFVVVNRASELRLRTLGVQVGDTVGAAQLPSRNGPVSAQNGVFALITVNLENRDRTPHRFSAHLPQALLSIGSRTYLERLDLERADNPDTAIRPGDTLKYQLVFDVSQADTAEIGRDGQLVVTNFGDGFGSKKRLQQIGEIRLYH